MSEQQAGLLPCPFCGEADAFTEQNDFSSSYVVCNNCCARGPIECQEGDDEDQPGRDASVIAWNARKTTLWQHDDMLIDVLDDVQRALMTGGVYGRTKALFALRKHFPLSTPKSSEAELLETAREICAIFDRHVTETGVFEDADEMINDIERLGIHERLTEALAKAGKAQS